MFIGVTDLNAGIDLPANAAVSSASTATSLRSR
jgi:hypothetical protein